MSNVEFVLNNDSAAWREVFLNNPDIRAGLAKYSAEAANRNTVALQSSDVRGIEPEHAFVAVIDKGAYTLLGKVVANSGEAKRAAIQAGLPHW